MKFRSIRSKILFYSSLCLLFLGASIITYATIHVRDSAIRKAHDQISFVAQDRAKHVQMELSRTITSLNTLAIILRKAKNPLNPIVIDRDEVDFFLQSVLKTNKNIVGVYTCWPPNGFDNNDNNYINEPGYDETGRFAPYWYRNKNGILEVEPLIHEDVVTTDDYMHVHKKITQLLITDPHMHNINGKDFSVVSLIMPISLRKEYLSFVGIDISCHSMQHLVREAGVEKKKGQILIINANRKIFGITGRPDLIGKDATKIPDYIGMDIQKMAALKPFVTSSHSKLQFFAPVIFPNSNPWWITVSLPREVITAEAKTLSKRLIFTGVGCIIVSIFILWFFSAHIVRSLNLLIKGVRQVGRGNYGHFIEDVGSYDEIGELASTFNDMAIEIKNKELERNKTEKALRAEKEFSESITNTANAIIVTLDIDGSITSFNKFGEDLTGYKKEEIIGKNWINIFIPSTNKTEIQSVHENVTTQSDEGKVHKNYILSKTGEKILISWNNAALINEKGHTTGAIAIGINITEKRQAEEALAESEEKYRSMMEAIIDPIYICSTDYRVEYMNSAMIERTGHDATGESCFKALHDLDEKCPWCLLHKTQTGDHFTTDIVSPKDNRSYVVSHSPIFHEDGSISKMTVYRDTTDFKKMETQLQQAQKMEAIGTLAGGIAHDFNNILFPIFGYLEMTLTDIPEDDPLRGNLEEVLNGAKRARDLVQQILTFSRQKDQDLKALKVQLVIKEVLKLVHSTLPTTIDIRQDISNECGLVMADPTQIHQIVMNLITNAYHAMEETGGKLTVNLKEVELTMEDLKDPAMIPGPHVCLTVADTGPGMDKGIIARIFDPYFTTKENGKGTGLGLAVVHGIVKSHGGNISLYSKPGKGTEFKVYLPVIKKQEETAQVETDLPIQKGDERILLVDDQDIIVQMEKQMLERLGYHVTARTSSVEALEAFRANPDKFDIIITDLTMPKMTGDKLAGELIKIRSEIPVILCTGFSERMSKEKSAALGIKGYLMKPVVMKELSKIIRDVLDNK